MSERMRKTHIIFRMIIGVLIYAVLQYGAIQGMSWVIGEPKPIMTPTTEFDGTITNTYVVSSLGVSYHIVLEDRYDFCISHDHFIRYNIGDNVTVVCFIRRDWDGSIDYEVKEIRQ